MQRKIGTVLDEKILRDAKNYGAEHHIPLNHLLEEALEEYLLKLKRKTRRFSGVEASYGIFKIPAKKLKAILEEEIYEVD